MRRNRVDCSFSWSTLLVEALAISCLIRSRGTQAFVFLPCSLARDCRRVHRPGSTAVGPAVGFATGLPLPSARHYSQLPATVTPPHGTPAWTIGYYRRTVRRERGSGSPRHQSEPRQQWHRCCASAKSEDDVISNGVMDSATRGSSLPPRSAATRLDMDLEATTGDTTAEKNNMQDELALQPVDEEDQQEGDAFPELPEEFKEMRGAFLDGPGQYLDVDKILAETAHIDHADVPEGFRTGYVTIVGSPNVGKSTLMNNMIGDRLSIVTPKAGTTRHRITGIMTGDDFQMIYQDTPGVLTPAYMLHEGMMNFVQEAMGDADAVLLVTDLFEVDFASPQIFERMLASGKPIVVAVNKVDLLPSDGDGGDGEARLGQLSAARLKEVGSLEDVLLRWQDRLPGATVLPISALEGINTAQLAEELKLHIPEGPPLFATDVMSDKPLRFFATEIIREQIFVSFSQEIPYSCEVRLERFKERKAETVIDATIVVSQESQKGMVIGKGGAKIKEVGIKARNALEEYLGVRVNLRLSVKLDKNWRKRKDSLKEYGYIS